MAELRIDGARVQYVQAGQGEACLLLHGYPQSHLCWRHQVPELARTHRVFAADWPGFGRSEPCLAPTPNYEVEVARIGQLADQLGLERFNLIGHDYGGFLGLGYTLLRPERVLRLALLNTRAHGTFVPSFYRFSQRIHWIATHRLARALGQQLNLAALHRRGLRKYLALGCFSEQTLSEYLTWLETAQGRRYYFDFFAHYHLPPVPRLAEGLSSVSCPTAIVWGARDRYIPYRTAEELAEGIPDAQLTTLAEADHFVMEERPEQVTAALRALLARPLGAKSRLLAESYAVKPT